MNINKYRCKTSSVTVSPRNGPQKGYLSGSFQIQYTFRAEYVYAQKEKLLYSPIKH
jgi:hypothetical protein